MLKRGCFSASSNGTRAKRNFRSDDRLALTAHGRRGENKGPRLGSRAVGFFAFKTFEFGLEMFQPAAFLDHDRLILLEQGCEIPETVLNFHDVGEMPPRLNVTVWCC